MKVTVIPEDQSVDRYIVQPVIEALFADLEVTANITVLPEPRLRGADDALDPALIAQVITDYPMEDLFVLVVDRDCNRQGHEAKARARVEESAGRLIACVAVQEVEVWMLALHKDALTAKWNEIRAHCDPKEAFAEPLLAALDSKGPGGGRKRAMRAIAGKWKTLRTLCNELEALQDEIRAWLTTRGVA